VEHNFTPAIKKILRKHFGKNFNDIYEKSQLIQYINIKTVSATRGSKSRSSFANLYAIYVLIEDYIEHGFYKKGSYSDYDGAQFSRLFSRQRQLPFGSKLQNHALNHRLNEEFEKFFPQAEQQPILRVIETKRYWINEKLIILSIGGKSFNIALAIIEIIDLYIKIKLTAFREFINTCEKLREIAKDFNDDTKQFIYNLLNPNVDARIFEIASYAILKYYYYDQSVYYGFQLDKLEKLPLTLYKTGRTNANDGGIDFVMKPQGRFFQVTETLDVRKYFLDIDKVERYPITFVIKSTELIPNLFQKLKNGAEQQYSIQAIVEKYMNCIEEIINIPVLQERLNTCVSQGNLKQIVDEIIKQSKVEFNIDEDI